MPLRAVTAEDRRALDREARTLRRSTHVPGLSLALVRKGRAPFLAGYGYRNVARRLPATARTVYGIASMTKSFTALAVLRLQEDGRLRVDDPVVRHLPGFGTPEPRWTRRILLHHLLTHTSGLPPLPSIYYTSGRSLARDPPYDPATARRVGIDPDHPPIDTYEGLLDYLRTERYRLLGPPGARFSYSNEAFGLLGAVIEQVTGRTYESYVEEAILRPLGMRATTFDTGIMLRQPEVTTLYSPHRTRPSARLVPSEDWWEDTCLRGAGALRTSVEDFLPYLELFLREGKVGRERVVDRATIRTMLRPHVPVPDRDFYGYGLFVRPDFHGALLAHHSGGLKGVSSQFAVVPRRGVAGVVLANLEMVPSELLLRTGVNRLLGLPARTPWTDLPAAGPTPARLGEFAGRYASGEGIWARVTAGRHALRLDFEGIEYTTRGIRLRPLGPDRFRTRIHGQDGSVRFLRGPDGHLSGVFLGLRETRRRTPKELRGARRGRIVW